MPRTNPMATISSGAGVMAAKVYRETAFFRYRGKFGEASRLACSEHAEELRRGVGQAGAAAGNQIDMTRHIELADFDFFHPAVFDFPLHAHARNDGHAHAHLDEELMLSMVGISMGILS